MTTQYTIKPCPFCGHDDVEIDEVDLCCYAVCCQECECIGPIIRNNDGLSGTTEAIMAWNNRRN